MKLLFFITSLGSGGAERVISILSNELSKRGHNVHIGIITNRNVCYSIRKEVCMHYLDCENDLKFANYRRIFRRIIKIRKLIKDLAPDCIISFMAETNIDVCFAMLGMDVPLIVSERNDPAIDPVSKLKQWIRKIAYCIPSYFIFQTPDAQTYFSKRIQCKSSIILNPLADNLPLPCNDEREKRIVSVGRLHPQKNIPFLLRAFSIFSIDNPDYILEIYGEGPLEEQLKKMVNEMNLQDKVVFNGFCKDVHKRIFKASMFILSSDYEGMPNALLEAMAMGIPCISTDCPCGGPRMLIEHKYNGQLIPIGNEMKMIQAMEYYANNEEQANLIGKKASEVNKRAHVLTIVEQWDALIRGITKKNEREKTNDI